MHRSGPPFEKRSTNFARRSRSLDRSRSSLTTRPGAVGPFFENGFSLVNCGFTSGPNNLPISIRGRMVSPTAVSMATEQCASICGAVIFPQSRVLSGRSARSRCCTSSAVDGSKRLFMLDILPRCRRTMPAKQFSNSPCLCKDDRQSNTHKVLRSSCRGWPAWELRVFFGGSNAR